MYRVGAYARNITVAAIRYARHAVAQSVRAAVLAAYLRKLRRLRTRKMQPLRHNGIVFEELDFRPVRWYAGFSRRSSDHIADTVMRIVRFRVVQIVRLDMQGAMRLRVG